MASEDRRYWKSLAERDGQAPPESEFPEPAEERLQLGLSRRGFLGAAGFALAGTVAGCARAPVEKAIPYLIQPENIVPGRANFYASTCLACPAGCGLLVKVRDGRPIKLEGNPTHPLSRGGLCAAGQASLLGVYDSQRLKGPLTAGKETTWDDIDNDVRRQLAAIRKKGGAVRFLTGTLTSPTLRQAIRHFVEAQGNGRHVVLDSVSCSAILGAHEQTHGQRVLPRYRIDRAEVLVGVEVDFLGSWIAPVEHARAYADARQLETARPHLSYHVQFEGRLSLTGSKADQRFRILPGEVGLLLTHLASRLAARAGEAFAADRLGAPPVPPEFLDRLASLLWANRRRALVLCGSQDVNEQALCNLVNRLLGSYGTTIDLGDPSFQAQGNDRDVAALVAELHEGKVSALFVHGCNPVHDLPDGEKLAKAIAAVPLLVNCAARLDETAMLGGHVCPDHHYLESWSDAEPVSSVASLVQPVLEPLFDTRSIVESVAAWSGKPASARDLIRKRWETSLFRRRLNGPATFEAFWQHALQKGHVALVPPAVEITPKNDRPPQPVVKANRPEAGAFALVLYPKVGMPSAAHAYNPWLHELPDPITKVAWDNYASLSPKAAAELGVADGDVIELSAGDEVLALPALVQPGQHDGVVAVALGYGSELSKRFAQVGPRWIEGRPGVGRNGMVGVNAAGLLAWQGGALRYSREGVRVRKGGRKHPLACSQDHHSLTVPSRVAPPGAASRPLVRETTLQKLRAGEQEKKEHAEHADLWPPDHETDGPRWGMVIDLNACTGCSACVVACQVENNIPVVGKDEVLRHREMHWLRIDRYYAGNDDVTVAHQPMLCQHCGNAPCEVVCPVLATAHSAEGLNQQVYNRCVGTRYCANNCPYKVRRFNWFDYPHDDVLENLVLNPDVTVRSRGVMEKCSFCVQRIQEARIEAKRLGIPLADGAIRTACQQSCPTQAIVFGDLADKKSAAARLAHGKRGFQVLAELNVKPAVTYLTLVRNRPEEKEGADRE